jgi:hypothetical protein
LSHFCFYFGFQIESSFCPAGLRHRYSASLVAGISGRCHHAQPNEFLFCLWLSASDWSQGSALIKAAEMILTGSQASNPLPALLTSLERF